MASQESQADQIIRKLTQLAPDLSGDDAAAVRKEVVGLSRQLTVTLEQPENTALEVGFAPLITTAARIAVQLNLFKYITDNNGPITLKELAIASGAEELLIVRMLRPLAAIGFVREVAIKIWEATPITKVMATEEIAAGYRYMGQLIAGPTTQAPKYFAEAGYRCPTDPRDGLMQYGLHAKLTVFELLASMPNTFKDFNTFMGNTMGARQYWVDWYPIETSVIDGATDESALLVDVAGGKGHDILAFHAKYPGRGRLVLEDLPAVVKAAGSIGPSIETVGYNFFTEQPVKGARAYFYHHILHDWSDDKCLEILGKVKKAMKPGYSKLLIHEMVVPEKGASTFHGILDLTMMIFNAGIERTESQWKDLMKRAGLKVTGVWHAPQEGADGIVEVMVEE
ncbi:putative O-methyltransferase [Nemania sp. NC0429]|nr:putative O-methyltransferase [Nemania sp. NC0429]